MTVKQKEIITWLCNPSADKYAQGLSLIQKYHQNKSIVRNFSGILTQDKKDKIQYELGKLAGYTFVDFQQKKWMLDNPALSTTQGSDVENVGVALVAAQGSTTDPLCPECNQPYTPQEGADPLCPDCLLKKKPEELNAENQDPQIIQDTLQNPSPETILNTEVIPDENQPKETPPVPDPQKPASKKSNPQTQPDPNPPSSAE